LYAREAIHCVRTTSRALYQQTQINIPRWFNWWYATIEQKHIKAGWLVGKSPTIKDRSLLQVDSRRVKVIEYCKLKENAPAVDSKSSLYVR
jgi:hypothetical protein